MNTDLKLLSQVLRRKDFITTLGSELNKTLRIEDVERTLIESIGKRPGLEFETQSLLSSEKKLAERLYEIKYSRDDWNLKMKGPLTLKDVLVDVYVAYPPTRSCKAIIDKVNSAMEKVRDKIEMRIWMRGKGLNGQGVPPGVVMPGGLMKASKESIVPAVIINGQITFSRDVPSKEEVEREIYKVLRD